MPLLKNFIKRILVLIFRLPESTYSHFALFQKEEKPFLTISNKFEDPKVRDSFGHYNRIPQTEYVFRVTGQLWIEPKFGYVFRNFRYMGKSLSYEPGMLSFLLPFLLAFTKKSGKNIITKDTVISFRDIYDSNYFHFFNDLLTRVVLVEEYFGEKDYPIVISRRLFEQRFFREAFEKNILGKRNLIVQDDHTYISANQVIFCKPMPHKKLALDKLLDKLQVPPVNEGNRKIFVIRKAQAENGRMLSNQAEIQMILEKYGFDTIDPGDMSLDDQIDLFAGSSQVVGIHGGGMANIIFRRENPMKVLELFPPDNIPPHYYWLAYLYGHKYDALVGWKGGSELKSSPFQIDPVALEAKVQNWFGREN